MNRIFYPILLLLLLLLLSVLIVPLITHAFVESYGETIINISGTKSNVTDILQDTSALDSNDFTRLRQETLALDLYHFARCDHLEGANYRTCSIMIERIEDGNNGSLTIPGTMALNITWWDH